MRILKYIFPKQDQQREIKQNYLKKAHQHEETFFNGSKNKVSSALKNWFFLFLFFLCWKYF